MKVDDKQFRILDLCSDLVACTEKAEYFNKYFSHKPKQRFIAWQNHSRKMMDELLKMVGEDPLLMELTDIKHELTEELKKNMI